MAWNSTLKRKTPLRAKKPWRPSEKRPWRRKAKPSLHRKFTDQRKAPLKKVSKAQRRRLTGYYAVQKDFLDENPYCIICVARGIIPPNAATEVHHIRGRAGRLLCDTRFFAASCFPCRSWPHDNTVKAREIGLLAEAKDWNVFPG